MLVADALGAVIARVLAGDAMAQAVDLAQSLDIDVDQLARRGLFIADHVGLGLKRRQTSQAQAAKNHAHRRARHVQRPGDLGAAHL